MPPFRQEHDVERLELMTDTHKALGGTGMFVIWEPAPLDVAGVKALAFHEGGDVNYLDLALQVIVGRSQVSFRDAHLQYEARRGY